MQSQVVINPAPAPACINGQTLLYNGTTWTCSTAGAGTHTGTITTGTIPKASGATTFVNSILTESGGVVTATGSLLATSNVTADRLLLPGDTSGTLTIKSSNVAGTTTLTLPGGTTDFSATGGTNQVVKQVSTGAAFTVGVLVDTVIGPTSTGTQNNWAPGLVGHTYISWGGASALTVTGFAGGVTGQMITFRNTSGTQLALFAYQSGSSSVGNRLVNFVTSASTPVAPGGTITYVYDGSNWVVVQHDQGAWITPTFAAGDFTGNGAMTWTVASGDVIAMRYHLRARVMTVAVKVNSSTVGGTPSSALRVGNGQWGGFTVSGYAGTTFQFLDAGSTTGAGLLGTGGTFLEFYRNLNASAWSSATDTTYLDGSIIFEVQ